MAQDFNVSMRLTLVDTASAQIKDFLAQLQGVEKSAPTINRSLNTLNRRLETTGKNAEKAATGVNSLLVMLMAAEDVVGPLLARFNALVNELRGVNQAAGNTARNMGKLDMSMQSASGEARRLVVPLQDVNAELQNMGTHAAQAGAGLGTVRSQMRGMGSQAQHTTNQVNTLADSLKGVAKLWGALKIEEGLKAAGKEGVAYENTRYRLDNLNLGPANNKTMIDAANAASRAVPQMDRDHMLTLALDLHNATGSVKDAALMLQDFAKAEYAMRRSLPKDGKFTDRDMLSVAKFLEQRGATQDPERMRAELDMVTKIISTTQGRVNPAQLLGNIQYSKFNLGQTMDMGFMPIFAAMIERSVNNGGSGGTVGTALTSLLSTVVAGKISHQMLPEWSKMGLINRDKVEVNPNGTIKRVEQGAVVGADLFLKNPYLWIQQVLLPAMQRAGINIKDDKAVVQKLTSMFGNRNAAQAAGIMATQQGFLEKDAGNITNSRGYQQQYDAAIKTAKGSLDTIKARLHDLGVIIGSQLLPLFEPLLKAVAAFVKDLVEFASNHEIITAFGAIAAGITSIVLAISGFKNLFGVMGKISGLFGGMGKAASTAGSTIGTATEQAASLSVAGLKRMGGAIGVMIGRLGLLGVAFATGFALGDIIRNLEVDGVKIGTWLIGFCDNFYNQLRNMWIDVVNSAKHYWHEFENVLASSEGGPTVDYTEQERQTRVKTEKQKLANNARLAARLKANGLASGGWGVHAAPAAVPPVHNVDPSGHHRTTYAPSKDLQQPFDIQKHKKAGGAGRHYNPGASEAQQDYRLEQDTLRDHLDAIKRLYDAGSLSIADYYKKKLAYTNQGIDLEIRALEKERAALAKDPKANKAQLDRLNTDIQLKQREKARQARDIEAEKQQDLNTLSEKALKLDENLAKSSGHRARARIMALNREMDAQKKEFELNGMKDAAGKVDKIKAQGTAQIKFEDKMQEVRDLQGQLALEERKINNAVNAGLMTQFDAERRLYALRKQNAQQIAAEIPALQKLAAATGNELNVAKVADLTEKTKGDMTKLTGTAKDMLNVTQNAFTGFFEGLTKAHVKLGDLLHQTFRNIAAGIDQLVSKILAQKVAAALFGVDQSGNPLQGGSGAGGTSTSTSTSMISSFLPMLAKMIGGSFASGIDYVPHDMLAIIHKGEAVVPAHVNAQRNSVTASKQSGVTNIHFHGLSSTPSQQTMGQIQSSVALGIQRANKRNN